MPVGESDKKNSAAASAAAGDFAMVGQIRVLLAVSVLLAVTVDSHSAAGKDGLAWLVTFWYLIHSIFFYLHAQLRGDAPQNRLLHWFDVFWYALIVSLIGGIESIFFFLFFFAILTASFGYGFEEGGRITLASVALFVAGGLLLQAHPDISQLLLRSAFLLSLGYISAHWGESMIGARRRLALLRDVSRLSNPRFGAECTMASVMEKIRAFFEGSACILVMQDHEPEAHSLRMVKAGEPDQAVGARRISADVASPLLAFGQGHLVFHTQPFRWFPSMSGGCFVYDLGNERWIRSDPGPGRALAELFEAGAFVSAPVSLRKGEGRIYVVSREGRLEKADALFLGHIVAQAFPVIDHIELLDHIASEAAVVEREKIARDLHDTVIQPYLGLQLGLSAVRNKAARENPLVEELDRLVAMTTQAVGELRSYAGAFGSAARQSQPAFLAALNRRVAQVREGYGVDIAVIVDGALRISDRMAAEVLHVVNEGLSNICRHTAARQGCIRIRREHDWLRIRIENEGAVSGQNRFVPRSITQRAAALGGRASVRQEADGCVAVLVDIPI